MHNHINFPRKMNFLGIAWYIGLALSLLFGAISTVIFCFGVWLLSTDFSVFRESVPILVERNYFLMYAVICAVTVMAAMGTVTTLTYAWSLFTRWGSSITTLFFNAILFFAMVQIWSGGIFAITKPGRLLVVQTLLAEAAVNFTDDSPRALRYANKWYGCCGVYNLADGCDQNYPGATPTSCSIGSPACQRGCLEAIDNNAYFTYNAAVVSILLITAFFSTISVAWRLWSHQEDRKGLLDSLPHNYVLSGVFLMVLGCGGLIHNFLIIRQYMPTYVTVNLYGLKVVAIMLIINGAARLPHVIAVYIEQKVTSRVWIARLIISILLLIQLGSGFTITCYYAFRLGKTAVEDALLYESNNNVTDGLLAFASRRFKCCGINDLTADGGRCDKTYPGRQCGAGLPNCGRGCLDHVWDDTIMSSSFAMGLGFVALNSITIAFMALGVIGGWIYQKSERCQNLANRLLKYVTSLLNRWLPKNEKEEDNNNDEKSDGKTASVELDTQSDESDREHSNTKTSDLKEQV